MQNVLVTFQKALAFPFSSRNSFLFVCCCTSTSSLKKSLGEFPPKRPTLTQDVFQLSGPFKGHYLQRSNQLPLFHLGWSQLSPLIVTCLSRYRGSGLPWDLSFLMNPRKTIDFSVCSAFPRQKDSNENVRARNKSSLDLVLNDETVLHLWCIIILCITGLDLLKHS